MSKHRADLRIGLNKAITKAGSGAALGRHLGLSRQAIDQWTEIPADRVVDVEKATGVPRQELRPDLYK